MGGIKNKSLLNKAINKVSLWLKGNVRRQSDKRVVLTKYLGIACLTLAILSTLILNTISSYSSSKVNSNAEPVSNSNANVSALADNEASANALDPTSISISISSYPSATGDTNDGNLSLSIPQRGGLVAGRHTVSVNAGNEIDSYMVYLNSATENKNLVNNMSANSVINSESSGASYEMPGAGISNNTWGVALPDRYDAMYADRETYESLITNPVQSGAGSNYKDTNYPVASIASPNDFNYPNSIGERKTGNGYNVYYVVRVDDPSTMLAGDYTTNVVYTVIAELKTPGITSISPNPIRTGTSNRITIKGHNLSIVSKVTIDDRGTIRDCTSITHSGTNNDTTLTCTLPAISNAGTYVITAETEGGQTTTTQIQAIPPVPVISGVSPSEINTNDSAATLTIVGTNLATTSSIYVDFNNNNSQDSGEACAIKTIADTQVTCTAPSRTVAGGPYTVRLTTNGGSANKTSVVSYVTPVPTVTSVSPSEIHMLSDYGQRIDFYIRGNSLNDITDITFIDPNRGVESIYCPIITQSSTLIQCAVPSWTLQPGGPYVGVIFSTKSGPTIQDEQFLRFWPT